MSSFVSRRTSAHEPYSYGATFEGRAVYAEASWTEENMHALRPVYSQRLARKLATRLRRPAKLASVFS